jgi:osmotically-inducible protein OsmY
MKRDLRRAREPRVHTAQLEAQQEQLADLMSDMYGGGGAGARAGEFTDAQLTESVQQSQDAEISAEATQIEVAVKQGWASWDGVAASSVEQEQLVQAALRVEGIEGVGSRVRVRDTG